MVEDESIIRETLRDTVPWAQYGYSFAGEAGDGEMALPLIRQTRPDVFITDVRMPLMDGLALSRMVSQEFPKMKIIIISGHDDFEYAQQAINIGVERYLLKPITKTTLLKVLEEVREKIEGERTGRSYAAQFHHEAQEYEQYARREFFERIAAGQLSVPQIYEGAAKLDIDLRAQCYTVALFAVLPGQSDKTEAFSGPEAKLRDALLEHFLKYPEYILLRWNLSTYAVLIKGDTARIDELIGRCTGAIRQQYETYAPGQSWYVAVGRPTQRLSTLADCFEEASRMWAYRYILPRQHILTADSLAGLAGTDDDTSLDHLSVEKLAPEILLDVMKGASSQDVPGFVNGYIHGVEEALSSKPFCQFLMLNVRFTATAFIESLELSRMEFLSSLSCLDMVGQNVTIADLEAYISDILLRAIEFRDRVSSGQLHSLLRQAVSYLDRHYADETLSLNQVAREVNISANYLSALFSRRWGPPLPSMSPGVGWKRQRNCCAPRISAPGRWRRWATGTRTISASCSKRPRAVRPGITGEEESAHEPP